MYSLSTYQHQVNNITCTCMSTWSYGNSEGSEVVVIWKVYFTCFWIEMRTEWKLIGLMIGIRVELTWKDFSEFSNLYRQGENVYKHTLYVLPKVHVVVTLVSPSVSSCDLNDILLFIPFPLPSPLLPSEEDACSANFFLIVSITKWGCYCGNR